MLLLAFPVGPMELVLIFAITLVLFGGSRLPTLMRSLGQSVNEFKKGIREEETSDANQDAKKSEVSK